MSKIKSDLSSKGYSNNMRQFEVEDESFDAGYDMQPDEHMHEEPVFTRPQSEIDAMNAHLAAKGFPPIGNVSSRQPEARRPQFKEPSLQEVEARVAEARKAKVTGRERLSDSAKKRIEMLCGMFNDTREVDLNGQVFVLRTLTGKELREASKAASLHDNSVELPFEIRKQFLARSLMQIAGTDVEMFLGDDGIEARSEFAEKLPEPVLNKLYGEYLQLVADSNKKYSINDEAEAQEVAADLKK